MDARRIARELLDLARGVRENDRAYELEVWGESDWSPLPPEDAQQHNISRRAGQMVDALARTLEVEGWAPEGLENTAPPHLDVGPNALSLAPLGSMLNGGRSHRPSAAILNLCAITRLSPACLRLWSSI